MDAGGDGMTWQLQLREQLVGMHQTCHVAHGEYAACSCCAKLEASSFSVDSKVLNWIRGFQHEREQRDTWTPFYTLRCESCGEDGCHWCVHSPRFNTFRQMPVYAPGRSEIDIWCVLFVNKGPTFRKESKNCSDRRHLQTIKNPCECWHCCDWCAVLERNLHQPELFRSLVWQRQVSLFLKYPRSRCQANKPAKNPKYAQVTLAFSCSLTITSHVTNIHRRHSLFEIYSSSIRICCFVLRTQVRFPLKVTQPKSWEAKARRVAGSPKPSFPANLGELWSLECVQDLGLEQEILWRQRGNQPTLQAKAQCWMALLSGYQTVESYLQNFVVVWNDPLRQDKVVCFGRDMTACLSNRVAMSHTNIQNKMADEVQKASMKPSVWAGHVSPP